MVLDGMCVWDIVLSWDVRNCGMGGHAQVLGRVVEKPDLSRSSTALSTASSALRVGLLKSLFSLAPLRVSR